ncbi:telomere repeats-binding bouquet formation protein 2 isoform X2 [Alosa alosa]|uniref:telomere repeats-binding bouquet formation protein 2 isoform X2 n=1 Tax=Alosa alosa TaxID=278164 RepID=UPI0020151AC6|nr:telomere repeats-binding bouquet formation protein 2 isoform X2 [Alosa alosa]
MFRNKTAWFSNSVKRGIRSVWVREGGHIVAWRRASYLFSDDASCPDTHRIFLSREYLEGELTVFHSSFITVCDVRQSVKSVPIGHYVLPPVPVQQEVKAKIGRFIWEQEDLTEGTEVQESQRRGHGDSAASKQRSEMSVDKVLMSLDELLMASGREDAACCEVQHYPVNNMVSGYVALDQLKRYNGELHDFLPGQGGYSVSVRSKRCHLTAGHPQDRAKKVAKLPPRESPTSSDKM